MKSKTATGLLGGWLLLSPPVVEQSKGKWMPDDRRPLTEWVQHAAYDTAKECERALAEMAGRAKEGLDKTGSRADKDQPSSVTEIEGAHLSQFAYSRCVPAEHIYPPSKPRPTD